MSISRESVATTSCYLYRSREDDRRRQGRGPERRPSPMPSRHRDRPQRSWSPRERRPREGHPREEHLQRRQAHSGNRSSEKKEEIGSSVPSDEEALDKLAQEVDKELAQRGISPKVPMTTVDISSSDNGSSDEEEEDVSEEEAKEEDDSQRHNTEDGELVETDETSMTESDDEDESPHRGPIIKSRMLRKAISGYGEGDSDASSSPDEPRQPSVSPPPPATEDIVVDEKPVVEPPVEEINTPSIDPNLPPYYPALYGCRNVEEYEWLNRIEEGTYGVVYRAKDKRTGKLIHMSDHFNLQCFSIGEVVALKKLKMEKEKEGFPITSLREINTLLKSHHPNIINVRVSCQHILKFMSYNCNCTCLLKPQMQNFNIQTFLNLNSKCWNI